MPKSPNKNKRKTKRKSVRTTAEKNAPKTTELQAVSNQPVVAEQETAAPVSNGGPPQLPELVAVIRHGEYDYNYNLDEGGREQIRLLSSKLKEIVSGKKTVMFTSTAARAVQTAEILSRELGVTFEERKFLHSGGGDLDTEQAEKALELIRTANADVVLLSTHFEFVESFPAIIGDKLLGARLCSNQIPKGSAWLVNCRNPSIILVSWRDGA